MDQLLAIVNTRAKYEQFKRFLAAARLVQETPVGPLYQAVPRANSPLDSYDPDRQLLAMSRALVQTYSRILHANLTGQYRLGEDGGIPRLASGAALDRHSLAVYFAPFRPRLSADDSVLAPWDRNAAALLPASEKPAMVDYAAQPSYLRRDFQQLVPLYTDYRGAGGLPSKIGVPLNRNSMTIVRYVKAMTDSAVKYRDKVREVAELTRNTELLKRTRQQLIKRLAEVQRAKLAEIRSSGADESMSDEQRYLVQQFADQFRQVSQQILDAGLEEQRRAAEQAAYAQQWG